MLRLEEVYDLTILVLVGWNTKLFYQKNIVPSLQVLAAGGLLEHPGRQAGLRRRLPELRGLISHGHQVKEPILVILM